MNQRPLRLAALYYFLFFGAEGIYLPFIYLYFDHIGLSGQAIGVLGALPPLLGFSSGPLWGALGDRFHIHRHLLPLATLGAILPTLLILRAHDGLALGLLVAAAALFSGPVVGLIDSAVLDQVQGTARSYGAVRWWGSLGFTLFAWATGYVLKWFGLDWLFYGYSAVLILAGLVSLWLPARRQHWQLSYGASLRQLLRQRPLMLFLASSFLAGATFTASYTFYPIYMTRLGANPAWLGLAGALAAGSEVPVLFFSGAILRRVGVRNSLILACLILALRWGILAVVTLPVPALLTSLLHGLTFGLILAGGVAYVELRTPAGLHATAQGLFAAVFFGVGAALGALGGGWAYDQLGPRGLFGAAAVIALAAMGFIVLAGEGGTVLAEGLAPAARRTRP